MRQKTVEAARGKWFGILRHFGVEENFLRNKHGECPMCGGNDRYRWDDKDGSGSYYCNQCGPGTGMDLLMNVTGMDFKAAAKGVDEIVGNVKFAEPKPKRDPRIRLNSIRGGLQPVEGICAVRRYLHGRGLKPSQTTRRHPALEYYQDGQMVGKFPAMVHLFQGADGQPLTYHVTYLTEGGEKAPVNPSRKVMTPIKSLSGGAIRLFAPAEKMGIAEGVETALAASAKYRIPVWSAYSANLLEQWEPPGVVTHVVIFADNDSSFTGQAAGYALAKRLRRDGLQVTVEIPPKKDTDFADEVTA